MTNYALLEIIIVKKRFALLLVFCFSLLAVLTGCNLFDTNNYAALSSKVASNGNVTITREQLINGYNSGGYYYAQAYGLSQEATFKRIIDELIDDEYYTEYIVSLAETDNRYKLTSQDYCDVISDVWDYISQGMSDYVTKAREVFGLSTEDVSIDDDSSDPEFATQSQYVTKFEILDDGRIAYIKPQDTKEHKLRVNITTDEEALVYAQTKFSYEKQIRSSSIDFKKMVWRDYIAALKKNQSHYNYNDMTDSAVFNREVKRLFDIVLKSAKQTKFQEEKTLSANFNYDANIDRYILNETALNNMVEYYTTTYQNNKNVYDLSKSAFFTDITNTSNRGNYVYYGDRSEETLITCSHILIKLSEDQTNEISAVESNSMYQGAQKTDKIANIVRADNTYAYERSLTTGEVVDEQGISVSQLYTEVLRDVNRAQTIEEKVETFNNYLYRYNVDPGIINAQFDYVVGTKTSPMVESFTNAVRELYDDGNGEVGSMTMVYEDNSSYKGYHIIIYTGVLDNTFDSISELNNLNSNNIYNMLGRQYTSLSYNETMFEFIYDKVAKDSFSTYKTELVSSLINGKTTEYITSNYKDLYAN